MLRELLDRIVDLGRDANEPKPIPVPDPRHALFVLSDGISKFDVPPAVIGHVADTVESLCAYLLAYAGPAGTTQTVWHDRAQVIGVLDEEDRRDRVSMPLVASGPWTTLRRLRDDQASAWMPQADFVRLLRITLGAAPELVAPFRRLRWHQGMAKRGDIAHGKESLGAEITGSLTGEAELPETLALSVPLWTNLHEAAPWSVTCLVDTNPATEQIRLVPAPGEIERVEHAYQADLHQRLVTLLGEKATVYYGNPSRG